MRALVALAVTLLALIVSEPTVTATAPAPTTPPGSFAPVVIPLAGGEPPEAARLPVEPSATTSMAILDPGVAPIPSPPVRRQPEVRPKAFVKRTAPVRYTGGTSHVLRGAASWYCNASGSRGPVSPCHSAYPDTGGFDAYGAAGPRLRAAIGGGWRGRVVSVDGLRVKLVDWCQCYEGQANEKLVDLYRDVYGAVGGSVTIRW